MKDLIVGLGNYPEKYHLTRHNFGFLAIDALAKKYAFSPWKEKASFFAFFTEGQIEGIPVVFCKPKTFMNESGKAVKAMMQYYRITPDHLWVFSDDLDLLFGVTRFREKGSSGGQKGLESIFSALKTQHIKRLKFGIANDMKGKISVERFVLSRFTLEEQEHLPAIIEEGLAKFLQHFRAFHQKSLKAPERPE